MQPVTASDFNDWIQNPVTKAFKLAMVDRITEAKDILGTQAGINTSEDNYLRGFIQAYREALEFRVDDLQGSDNGN